MISAVCYSCYDEPAARKLFVQRAKSLWQPTRGEPLGTSEPEARPHARTLPAPSHPPHTLRAPSTATFHEC